jgi:hypothetical protein
MVKSPKAKRTIEIFELHIEPPQNAYFNLKIHWIHIESFIIKIEIITSPLYRPNYRQPDNLEALLILQKTNVIR